MITLPSGKIVSAYSPIYQGSNFLWYEATKDLRRMPEDLIIDGKKVLSAIQIEDRIISTAQQLDKIRAILGNRPLHVNSWYRPRGINSAVGGSKYSRHQFGDGVDIRSDYFSPRQIYRKINWSHQGGLAKYRTFVHIDWRGYKARW